MHSRSTRIVALCCLLVACAPNPTGAEHSRSLFDGATLQAWSVVGETQWRVANGELIGSAGGDGMLVFDEQFADYTLSLEFWVDETVNSGVFIRCQDPAEPSPFSCYEVNIWDLHPRQEYRSGAIVRHVSPPLARVDTVGRWNRYQIEARANQIRVTLNGVLTAELTDSTHASGYVALQRANGGEVRFRNVTITEQP